MGLLKKTTTIGESAYKGDYKAVKDFIEKHLIDPNECDELSRLTPLHQAARRGHIRVVDVLLRTPCLAVNARDSWNGTALHNAAAEGHIVVIAALLEKKILEINPINNFNQTPLDLAIKYKRTEIIQLLKEHGAKTAPSPRDLLEKDGEMSRDQYVASAV